MRLPLRRRPQPMACQELVELITHYFDGALSKEDARRFDAHIAACPHCSLYLEQMRVTIRTVGRIETDSITLDMRTTLLAAFSDWRAGEQPLP